MRKTKGPLAPGAKTSRIAVDAVSPQIDCGRFPAKRIAGEPCEAGGAKGPSPSGSGRRIRCHGDYHLRQVLYTGTDFQIFDFEGPSAQSLQERRIKRSPLRDVAGMLRSFEYAAYTILLGRVRVIRAEDAARLEPWGRFWPQSVSGAFLRAYLEKMGDSDILPTRRAEIELLLGILLVDRALEEIRFELELQPEWVIIPLKGVARLLEPKA